MLVTPPPPPNLSSSLALRRLSPLLLLAAALFALAVFFAPGAQPAAAQDTTIWSATLTVQSYTAGIFLGCEDTSPGAECSSALTDNDFTYGGVDYAITGIGLSSGGLSIMLDNAIPMRSRLHVGNLGFSLTDATLTNGNRTANWLNTGLTWTAGDTVTLSLTEPPITGTLALEVQGATPR